MADFDVRQSSYGIEFTPTSDDAWAWLRQSGKIDELVGVQRSLLRDQSGAAALYDALIAEGMTLTGCDGIQLPVASADIKAQVQHFEASAVDGDREPQSGPQPSRIKAGHLLAIGIPIALVALAPLAINGGGLHNPFPAASAATEVRETADRTAPSPAADQSDPIAAKVMADLNLKALLKDPDSAKFRNVVVTKIPGGNLMLCGEVNSKNAFGGYTGYKGFIASPNPEAPTIIDGENPGFTHAMFRQAQSATCSNVVERFS